MVSFERDSEGHLIAITEEGQEPVITMGDNVTEENKERDNGESRLS